MCKIRSVLMQAILMFGTQTLEFVASYYKTVSETKGTSDIKNWKWRRPGTFVN